MLGLLGDGERKSAEPIAARAAGSDPALCRKYQDHLCHSLNSSRWDDPAVRSYGTSFALRSLLADEGMDGWIVDDTGFLRQGTHSPGVQRRYTGTAGKITNCQIAVGLTVATPTQHLPVAMDLCLPES